MRRVVANCGVALGALAAVGLVALPASAARVKTHLIADPTSITLAVGGSATVTTHLDDACLKVFENASDKTFGVAVGLDPGAVVSVTPMSYNSQGCTDTQSFSVTGLANGVTTVRFDPVASNTGLTNQMAGASVQVTVGSGGTNPPGHGRPAAPAVANAHVPHGSALAATCQQHYSGAKNWRGLLIKDIAHWAHENHLNQTKDTSAYATDDAWILFVDTHVDSICNAAPTT